MIRSAVLIIYVVVGIFVADHHKYFSHVVTFLRGVSAALAIVLWPLILGGVNLHLH